MDIKNIKKEEGKVSFQAIIDGATFETAVNKAYQKAKKDIFVPVVIVHKFDKAHFFDQTAHPFGS